MSDFYHCSFAEIVIPAFIQHARFHFRRVIYPSTFPAVDRNMLCLLFCSSRFDFGEAFLDEIQLLPQDFRLVLEHLCLHFRIRFLVRRLISIRRSTRAEAHPHRRVESEEPIPPTPSATTESTIPIAVTS